MAIEVRKQVRWVGVNRHWSAATRATVVVAALFRTTRRWRKLNHQVAAGPKIAIQLAVWPEYQLNMDIWTRTSAVQRHAPSPAHVMFVESLAVNQLLGQDIATAKQDLRVLDALSGWLGTYSAGDAGCEDGPAGEFGLVPGGLDRAAMGRRTYQRNILADRDSG